MRLQRTYSLKKVKGRMMTMSKAENVLIIDAFNLAHRAQHKFNLSTATGTRSGVAYGFIYILSSMVKRFSPNRVITVFDGGRAQFRKDLLPDYKARENTLGDEREHFMSQIKDLEEYLPYLNTHVYYADGVEADDAIAAMVLSSRGINITLVSSDKDFIPLLGPRFKIFNPFKNKLISTINVKKEYGFDESEFLDFLILDGDKSDHIPGVFGLGPKRIRAFLDTYGSIENFLDSNATGPFEDYRDAIEEVYIRNKRLIDLRYSSRKLFGVKRGKIIVFQVSTGTFDLDKLKPFLHKYQLNKFRRDGFLDTFKNISR